jgi:hypothetical protein
MSKIAAMLFFSLLFCGTTLAQDAFEAVTCSSNIPKVLVGKKNSNGRVVVIEGRHKDLNLKNLGGIEISDRLFLESWSICGREFELLVNVKSQLISAVLLFPAHSARAPMFIGECESNHTKLPDAIVAVLDNIGGHNARDSSQANTLLKATAAWKIDESNERFAVISLQNLSCPLDGIVTVDGGR